jgi:hypothetical protein
MTKSADEEGGCRRRARNKGAKMAVKVKNGKDEKSVGSEMVWGPGVKKTGKNQNQEVEDLDRAIVSNVDRVFGTWK